MIDVEAMLGYLSALEKNNNREWFHAHAAEKKSAIAAFETLIDCISSELRKFDDSIPFAPAKELSFKLTRDTRFSYDKSPYNASFRAHIAPKGKLPIPVGYYVMIKPNGRSFLGGGLFADVFATATSAVREAIAAHGAEWQNILDQPEFAARYTVGGTKLKNVPRGYDPAHPQAEFLKHKNWYLEFPVADDAVAEPDFAVQAALTFRTMKAFNDFLNRALIDFEMPER